MYIYGNDYLKSKVLNIRLLDEEDCIEKDVVWEDSAAKYLREQAAQGSILNLIIDYGDRYSVDTNVYVDSVDLTLDLAGNANLRRFTVKVTEAVPFTPSGVDDSCVLYLPMDEGNGETVYDKSGYNNHGTINGAIWTDGKYGKALSFDGIDDYVEIPDNPSLKFGSGDFTITLWALIDPNTPDHGGFIAKGAASRAYGVDYKPTYCIRPTFDGRVAFYIEDGVSLAVIDAYKLWDGEWHFYTGVREGNTLKFYVDAELVGTRDITDFGSTDNDYNLVIGRQTSTGGKILLGKIDEPQLYNRPLTEDEIEWLYRSGLIRLSAKYLQPTGLEQTLFQKTSDTPKWEDGAFKLEHSVHGQTADGRLNVSKRTYRGPEVHSSKP